MAELKIQYKKISEIKPYERNPRINDNAVDMVSRSIEKFGFKVPIIIDKNDIIIAGHTRYKAAKKLGLSEVPCVVADDLTDEQIKAFRIIDNKTAEMSEWDESLLALELMDIRDIDMSQFGFDSEEEIEDTAEEVSRAKEIEPMELKQWEHHDYIVFVFEDEFDWLNAVNEFGIHKVDAGYGTTKKVGVGRVIDGKRLLEKIQH